MRDDNEGLIEGYEEIGTQTLIEGSKDYIEGFAEAVLPTF